MTWPCTDIMSFDFHIFITSYVQLVLSINVWEWGYWLESGKPASGHILQKERVFFPQQLSAPTRSSVRDGAWKLLLSLLEVWTDLLLCCSCAGNHGRCEFKSVIVMSGPEKTHFIAPLLILLFHSFCPHFWDGPWTLLHVAACLEGSASYS